MLSIIKTEDGMIRGFPDTDAGITVFRGVPYAAPPVGELRWKPPQPVKPWTGIRACAVFSQAPPQGTLIPPPADRAPGQPPPRPSIPQSEDCLYLNVLTPARNPEEKLPVMVWMHGGGFAMGSGNEILTNSCRLPQHGVVLVTVNGRLGPFGLAAHPALTAESAEHASGNYLFLDLIAALQWVQKNINAFGGDKDNVTIFGESGGGAKVISLIASPLARGLFHKAIAESGSPDAKPLAELEAMGERFFNRLGITSSNPLEAARRLPWERIIEVDRELTLERNIAGRGGIWDAAIDGRFLSDTPLNLIKSRSQAKVPLIVLANQGELTTAAGAYLVPHYLEELRSMAHIGVPGRAIIFDQVPSLWRQEGCFSCHALELGYVFGDWDNTTGFWDSIYMMARSAGAKSKNPGLNDVDRFVSEQMMQMWTQFALTGNPYSAKSGEWPVWEENTDSYLYINGDTVVRTGFSQLPAAFKNK
ncbi:MAG TPA: carboxylesterase family protein [Dehalococcoidales bacterium]|nr:carboxylesterase family protein [Dehalococcoidales bacterium]